MDPASVFENLPLPALLVAPDRTLLGFNRLMLQYQKEIDREDVLHAAVGQDWTSLSPTVALAEQGKAFHHEVFSKGGVVITEWEMPGNRTAPVHGRYWGHRIEDGNTVTGAVLVREDVSRALGLERMVRRQQLVFELMAEHVRDIVLITDVDGTIIRCNPAGLTALGYESSEIIGQPISILSFDPEGQPGRWRELLDERGGLTPPQQVRRADGTSLAMQWDMIVVGEEDERFVCVWGRDLSTVRREENLQRLASLGNVAGGIAHDFNNALSGISGRLSLAELEASGEGELPRLLAEAQKAVDRASQLTKQLLTFAKGGKPEIKRVEIASLVAAEAEFAVAGSGLQIHYSVEDDLWDVAGDRVQLAQVVENLVCNAIQATGGKGSMAVSLRNVEVQDDDGPRAEMRRYVELEFSDDGPGVPPEVRDQIFDLYFSTKNSSGLGLAIVQSVVHDHGGFVSFDSVQGSGATFTIRLPAHAEDTIDAGEESSVPEVSGVPEVMEMSVGQSLRALVMEDDDFLRLLMRDLFLVLGHQVDVASDGDQALLLFQAALDSGEPYDVAVLDVTIRGGVGGQETGNALLERQKDLPIFLMSGYHEIDLASSFGDSGFRGFLKKPFSLDTLRNALQTVLS